MAARAHSAASYTIKACSRCWSFSFALFGEQPRREARRHEESRSHLRGDLEQPHARQQRRQPLEHGRL
eukprot:2297918-Prymnesium_polylepis.1